MSDTRPLLDGAEFSVRAATAGDLPTFGVFRGRMFRENGWTDVEGAHRLEGYQTDYIAGLIRDGVGCAYVAEVDGEIVGVIAGRIDRGQPGPDNPTGLVGYMMNLYVLPEFRRRGISRALSEAVMADLHARGIGMFSLWASENSEPLYRSMGFEFTRDMRLGVSRYREDRGIDE